MPNLLIRDLAPGVLESLKAQAKRNNRSMTAEAKHILERSVPTGREDWLEEHMRIREPIGSHNRGSSAPLIREDRQNRPDRVASIASMERAPRRPIGPK